jgi:hypothetical protein
MYTAIHSAFLSIRISFRMHCSCNSFASKMHSRSWLKLPLKTICKSHFSTYLGYKYLTPAAFLYWRVTVIWALSFLRLLSAVHINTSTMRVKSDFIRTKTGIYWMRICPGRLNATSETFFFYDYWVVWSIVYFIMIGPVWYRV